MITRRGIFFNIDWGLIIPAIILVILSLTALFSVSTAKFSSQLLYVLIALCAFFFFSQVNYKIVQLHKVAIYIISLILLVGLLIIGTESRGAIRWLDIFGLRIQFSEVLRPFLIIAASSFLAQKDTSLKTFLLTAILASPILLLIAVQPDLGNALIYLMSTVFTLFIFGFPLLLFLVTSLLTLASIPIFWNFLHDYQKERFLTFVYTSKDPLGTSYNAIQSVIAVGSGNFFGKGLGEATQSGLEFLPERHTDFIFATLSEELGFIGASLVLICFGFLLFRIFSIFSLSDDTSTKLFVAFSFSFLLIQFFVNIGMNIGILPVVGISLPFVSYGGSSLLSNFIILGLLSSITYMSKDRKVLEIR